MLFYPKNLIYCKVMSEKFLLFQIQGKLRKLLLRK